MTLPSSGTLGLSAIQTEFGGSNPISLSEYYAAASGVPASGKISISDFYGKSSETFPQDGQTVGATGSSFFGGTVTWYWAVDGTCLADLGFGGPSVVGSWRLPNLAGVGSNFEIKVHLTFGSPPSGMTYDTWLSLSSARSLTLSSVSAASSEVTFQIRRAGSGTIVTNGTCALAIS